MVHMSVSCTSGRRGLAGYVRTCGLDMVHMNADMPLIVWREQFGGCVSMLSERWATQCQRQECLQTPAAVMLCCTETNNANAHT